MQRVSVWTVSTHDETTNQETIMRKTRFASGLDTRALQALVMATALVGTIGWSGTASAERHTRTSYAAASMRYDHAAKDRSAVDQVSSGTLPAAHAAATPQRSTASSTESSTAMPTDMSTHSMAPRPKQPRTTTATMAPGAPALPATTANATFTFVVAKGRLAGRTHLPGVSGSGREDWPVESGAGSCAGRGGRAGGAGLTDCLSDTRGRAQRLAP